MRRRRPPDCGGASLATPTLLRRRRSFAVVVIPFALNVSSNVFTVYFCSLWKARAHYEEVTEQRKAQGRPTY